MTQSDWPERISVTLDLDAMDTPGALQEEAGRVLGVPAGEVPDLYVRKRSLDARRGKVRFHLLCQVGGVDPDQPEHLGLPHPREVKAQPHVVIVGGGPAGLFCAYELARAGIASTVIERGKEVQPRRRDLKGLNQRGEVDPDSNYCFGEGGAGTYSDGKLYTRAHKRGAPRDVLEVLALHGAPAAVLTEARPHIGSNRLPKVVTSIRERLQNVGVRFVFQARVTGLLKERGRVRGVQLGNGDVVEGDAVVLATGHSARDVFEMLLADDVAMAAKAFALGVRIEHPQPLINAAQYGAAAGHPLLPAASYTLKAQVQVAAEERGCFSFCMCPGGFIVPAATENGGVVVNGMSLSRRDSPFANSGLVVAVQPSDFGDDLRAGIAFQRAVEQAAFEAGGGQLRAPATRVSDFVARRASSTVPQCSYQPGLFASDLRPVLDAGGVPIADILRQSLVQFGQKMPGYISDEGVLVGVESRTSSPLRILRDPQSLQSPSLGGLYPCGEGAGYAGGIVSAAIDGLRVAKGIVAGFS